MLFHELATVSALAAFCRIYPARCRNGPGPNSGRLPKFTTDWKMPRSERHFNALVMRKIVFETGISLDGFIEGPNGELDWLDCKGARFDTHAFVAQFDTIFYGRKAYERFGVAAPADVPAGRHSLFTSTITQMRKYVFSRKEKHVPGNGMVVSANLEGEVRRILEEDGKNIWFGGGPEILRTFVELDLVDEYVLTVYPVVLSEGKSLFSGIKTKLKLRLIGKRNLPSGLIVLHYRPENRVENRYLNGGSI